jgi:hypothetical protein
MTPPTEADLISVIATVLALVIGPRLAPIVGIYVGLLLGWCAGCMIGLLRRDPKLGIGTGWFVAISLLITLGVTVPIAAALSNALPGFDYHWFVFPLAVIIPTIGTDWFAFGAWVWENVIKTWLLRRSGGAEK